MTIDKEFLDFVRTEFNAGLTAFRDEVKAGFNELAQRQDQTNQRLDSTILMVRDFRKDMSERLDGIGTYLRSIDSNVMRHEERLRILEDRVDRLENAS